jgi:hypothetical protein
VPELDSDGDDGDLFAAYKQHGRDILKYLHLRAFFIIAWFSLYSESFGAAGWRYGFTVLRHVATGL